MRVKDKVENFLKQSQDYRDSDKKLLLAYWEMQGLALSDRQKQIFMERCTIAESITRARRALMKEYPASEAVDEVRHDKFVDYKYGHAVSWLKDEGGKSE